MKMKKLIALLLCIAMIMCTLASCGTSVDDILNEYAENEASTRDYETARAAYDADMVVATVDGTDITWDEYFGWICYALSNYESTYGTITDFTTATAIGTISDTIIEDANYGLTMYKAIEKKAAELGVEYPENLESLLESDRKANIEYFGDEEAFDNFIKQYYGTREMYEYIYKMGSISPDMFEYYYGKDGADLTDEQLTEGSKDFIMAKHILVKTIDDATGLVLEEEDQKAAQETIESVYDKLTAYEGDDLEGYFDELTAQYTEDQGFLTYPEGYLFQEGDMVTEFYNAALSIEEGQFSEIVESSYGYHIIMRIPINYDSTPMALASYGYDISLRYYIANELFSAETESWMENVTVETTDDYETIDLAHVFPAEN